MKKQPVLLLAAMLLPVLTMAMPAPARARLTASIDLSRQVMTVSINGRHAYSWPVSSGRRGYRTPTGSYRPGTMKRMHYSRKYHNSPMPWSVFFRGGYAIHGTYATKALGRPASHGCVRLHPANAKTFYRLIRQHGKRHTRIIIRGRTATPRRVARSGRNRVKKAKLSRRQHLRRTHRPKRVAYRNARRPARYEVDYAPDFDPAPRRYYYIYRY